MPAIRSIATIVAVALSMAPSLAVACDTSDSPLIFTEFQGAYMDAMRQRTSEAQRSTLQAAVHEYFQKVEAEVSTCRRGDLITIPVTFVKRYCDFGKHVDHERDMVTCVKR